MRYTIGSGSYQSYTRASEHRAIVAEVRQQIERRGTLQVETIGKPGKPGASVSDRNTIRPKPKEDKTLADVPDGTVVLIDSFDGEYFFLSNFFPSPIRYGEIVYPTVEHAYQAMKNTALAYREVVASRDSPGKAKWCGSPKGMAKLGFLIRKDWESIKLDVMLHFLRLKFQYPTLREALLATGDAHLVEGNTWRDTYWGVYRGVGENHLGQLLEQVRGELRGTG